MTPRENKPSCHDVMVDKWEPTSADIRGNRLPGFGVTTNIINGGLECNRPGNAAVEDRVKYYERYAEILGVSPGPNLYCGDQRPFGQDASFALSKSGGGASAGVVRVDKKGRTCSTWGRRRARRRGGASSTARPRPARAGPRTPRPRHRRARSPSRWTARAAPARSTGGASATGGRGAPTTPPAGRAKTPARAGPRTRPRTRPRTMSVTGLTARAARARTTGGASATGSRGAPTTMAVGRARTLEPTRIIPSRSSDPLARLPHSRVETSGPLPTMPPWGIDAAWPPRPGPAGAFRWRGGLGGQIP